MLQLFTMLAAAVRLCVSFQTRHKHSFIMIVIQFDLHQVDLKVAGVLLGHAYYKLVTHPSCTTPPKNSAIAIMLVDKGLAGERV